MMQQTKDPLLSHLVTNLQLVSIFMNLKGPSPSKSLISELLDLTPTLT